MTRFYSRAFGPRSRTDEGFSMVEMMVALLIIAIVSAASIAFFVDNIRGVNDQRQHQEAVYLADQQMENVQSLPVAKLASGRTHAEVTALFSSAAATALNISGQDDTTNVGDYDPTASSTGAEAVPLTVTQTVNHVPYALTTFIDVCWYSNTTGFCTPTSATTTTQEYRASVYVTWKSPGTCVNGCNYSTSTLIDPSSDPLFDTNISTVGPGFITVPTSGTVVNDNDADTCTTNGSTYPGDRMVYTDNVVGAGVKANVRVLISAGGGTIPAASIYQPSGTEVDFCLQTYDQPGIYTISVINTDGGHDQVSITEVPNITGAGGWTPAAPSLTVSGGGFEAGATFTATNASWGSVTGLVSGKSINNGDATDDSVVLNNFVGPTNGNSAVITVTNPDLSSDTFTITAPKATAVSRAAIVAGQTMNVTVTGTGFENGFTPVVTNATLSALYVSPTTITLTMTGMVAGTPATVYIGNPDGGSSNTFSFAVDPPPVVLSATPNTVVATQPRTVTVTGTGFVSGMTLAQSNGSALTVVSLTATTLVLSVTAATGPGTDVITMTNPDGGMTSFSLIVDAPPVIANVTPNPIPVITTTTLTLTGTGFQTGLTVTAARGTFTLGTVTPTSVTLSGFSTTTTGPDLLTVTNPDSGVSTFSVMVDPTITAISPNPVITNKATTVTITGTGFVSGLTVNAARGTFTLGTVTATSITLNNFTVTTAGADVLTVNNPDGSAAAVSLTVDAAPTISSITGNPVVVSQTKNLTIVGTGFVAGAVVTAARGTFTQGALTGTSIVLNNFNVTSLGADVITVTNPDGGQATFNLTVDSPPTITAITPLTVKHSTSKTYTLTGTGFVSGFAVAITENGNALTTSGLTFTSSTSIMFGATAKATPTSGSVTLVITVTNPDGGVATFTATATAS